jgi:hypothetical protein
VNYLQTIITGLKLWLADLLEEAEREFDKAWRDRA